MQVKLTTLKEKINTLKKYKEGLVISLIKHGSVCGKITDFVSIQDKTKLPSSYGKAKGKYPFFINNDEGVQKYCDEYCFNGTYLILNTGGSASIKLYQGKFSAMSDCLVIKPKSNPIGIYFYLKYLENKINKVGFQGTCLKHLDQRWLLEQIALIPKIEQGKLEKVNTYLDNKLQVLMDKEKAFKEIKNYLLSNLFI